MIDYNSEDSDPIVAEVRNAREQFAASFDFDLRAMFEALKRRQGAGGNRYASLKPVASDRHLADSVKSHG